ncbi:MAG: sensor domain-containing diguanylate cyclase [Firmicutes bacterium]|nr:sensor domain-containing diguanylate cyclase [Bacillota bacterium]
MDLQSIVDSFQVMSAVFSFEIQTNGVFGEIYIEAANAPERAFLATHPKAPDFYPGVPLRAFYKEYNFENFVYKCGVTGEPLYSYINAYDRWMKNFFVPVKNTDEPEEPNEMEPKKVYCLFFLTVCDKPMVEDMLQCPPEVANYVLKLSIKLHRTEDFCEAMVSSVLDIKKICNADRCSLYMVDQHEQTCRLFGYEGEREEFLNSFSAEMGRTPYELAMAWERDLAGSDCLLLDDLRIIKEIDPVWYESLCLHGIKNIILYAIRYHNCVVGYIWAADYDTSNSSRIKEALELASFILASVIANYQVVSQLKIMSTTDGLTQVNNRNAMNIRIDKILSGETPQPQSMGVLFTDINGLKTVNDTFGHGAGDKLIKKAAAILNIVFADYEVYRSGGDEFVVFCPDISREEFDKNIEQLKSLTDSTADISAAIGAEYFADDYDILRAMHIVDEKMYRDKEAYYRLNPDKDRRRR